MLASLSLNPSWVTATTQRQPRGNAPVEPAARVPLCRDRGLRPPTWERRLSCRSPAQAPLSLPAFPRGGRSRVGQALNHKETKREREGAVTDRAALSGQGAPVHREGGGGARLGCAGHGEQSGILPAKGKFQRVVSRQGLEQPSQWEAGCSGAPALTSAPAPRQVQGSRRSCLACPSLGLVPAVSNRGRMGERPARGPRRSRDGPRTLMSSAAEWRSVSPCS